MKIKQGYKIAHFSENTKRNAEIKYEDIYMQNKKLLKAATHHRKRTVNETENLGPSSLFKVFPPTCNLWHHIQQPIHTHTVAVGVSLCKRMNTHMQIQQFLSWCIMLCRVLEWITIWGHWSAWRKWRSIGLLTKLRGGYIWHRHCKK